VVGVDGVAKAEAVGEQGGAEQEGVVAEAMAAQSQAPALKTNRRP